MKSKKLISIMTLCSMLLCTPTSVYALDKLNNKQENNIIITKKSTNISKEAAQNIAKKNLDENFNIKTDKDFNCGVEFRKIYSEDKDCYAWFLNFEKINTSYNFNINVMIDSESGKVLEVYVYDSEDSIHQQIASLTESEALKIADKFINKLCPEESKEVKCVGSTKYGFSYSTDYEFVYTRTLNNIPFNENFITVSINGTNGKINRYTYSWDKNLKVKKVNKTLSETEAKKLFDKNLKMKLNYNCYTDRYSDRYSEKDKLLKPVYTSVYENSPILDAETGKWIKPFGEEKNKVIEKDLNKKEKQELYSKAKPLSKYPKELTKEQASKQALNILKKLYGKDYEIKQMDYSYNGNFSQFRGCKASWHAFTTRKDDKNQGANIALNAENGAIVNLSKFNYEDNKKTPVKNSSNKFSFDKAYKNSLNLILQNHPDKLKEIETKQIYIENNLNDINSFKDYVNNEYSLNFVRKVNETPYPNNNINISYDIKTGELSEFNVNWEENLNFPSVNKCLNENKAKEIYMNKFTPKLAYKMLPVSSKNKELKLVYALSNEELRDNETYMDGFTGKFLNEYGEDIDENIGLFKEKIQGNKYEKELLILAFNNIIDTKDFNMNKNITNMDLIKMIVNAKGYRPYLLDKASALKCTSAYKKEDANYKYLQMAVEYGLIENTEGKFNPDEIVTRESMAKYLIKIIGFENLAKCTDIFKLEVSDSKDINKEDLGYMAIAKSLKLLQVQDNKLNPKQNATNLELCIAIYNILSDLRAH